MRNNGIRVCVAIEHLKKKAKSANSFVSLKASTDFTKLTLRSLNSIQTVEGTFILDLS